MNKLKGVIFEPPFYNFSSATYNTYYVLRLIAYRTEVNLRSMDQEDKNFFDFLHQDPINKILRGSTVITILFGGIGILKYLGFTAPMILSYGFSSLFLLGTITICLIIGLHIENRFYMAKMQTTIDDLDLSEDIKQVNDNTVAIGDFIVKTSKDMKQVLDVLVSVNNTVKGIPNRSMIIRFLSFRTRSLTYDLLECIIGYTTSINKKESTDLETRSPNDLLSSVFRRVKNSERIVDKGIDLYIEDIYRISRGTLSESAKDPILEEIKRVKTIIISSLTNPTTTEDKIYDMLDETKKMEKNIAEIIRSKINITSFVSVDDEEERDC